MSLFEETEIKGAFIVKPERIEDERGYFARTWCKNEWTVRNLETRLLQCSVSFNKIKGTLRGMHYQAEPYGEVKLVRCTRGRIYDVILDLRRDSVSYGRWLAFELSAENGLMLYIPKHVAHGFQTLEDSSEVFYQISEVYVPTAARGVRYNDPAFAIKWPHAVTNISERDANYSDYMEEHNEH